MEVGTCNHFIVAGKNWDNCPRCGSTCERDDAGAIVLYTRGTLDRPRDPIPTKPDPAAYLAAMELPS